SRPAASLSTPTCTKPSRSRKAPTRPRARCCNRCARATSCGSVCYGPPASSWPRNRPRERSHVAFRSSEFGFQFPFLSAAVTPDVEARLLRSPRRGQGRERRRDQEGLPQAGGEVSSGQESGRQGGGGEVQGTGRGL